MMAKNKSKHPKPYEGEEEDEGDVSPQKIPHQRHQRDHRDERPLIPPVNNPLDDPPAPVGKQSVYHDPKASRPGGDPLRREHQPIEERYNPVDDGVEPLNGK